MAKSEAHFNVKIVNLYCGNGCEYLSNDFKDFCSQKGITFHLTVPYNTPQQNGVAERMNRTITEKARAMICSACLYEMWHGHKPQLNFLKLFGSTVYVHLKIRPDKFDKKSIKCIFVGYEHNGYKLWNVETAKFITARDVIFDEINFKVSRPCLEKEADKINKAPIIKTQTSEISDDGHGYLEIPTSTNLDSSKTRIITTR